MKRQWHIRRGTVKRPDAQHRWDRAYQSILRWSFETEQTSGLSVNGKEEYHAGGGLRAGFDLSTGQALDD